jgi:cytochrome c oxidase assembly protein subunit 15
MIEKNKQVAIWLFVCSFLVFTMVLVGGLTRLTESGLSIVEWKPIHGTIPPLSLTEWQEEFDSYKASPEYLKKNYGMSLEEFKFIFWWEFAHRLLGRLLGIAFLIPFIYFTAKRYFTKVKAIQLLFIFSLGGLQGFIGWWMVKSGLINNPAVSHFRLATHLSLALIIFCLLFWQAIGFYLNDINQKKQRILKANILSNHLIIFVFVQIIFGAFIAGLDAGLTYNTWPLMDGRLYPQGLKLSLYNIEFIQFFHRWWAFLVLFFAGYFYYVVKKTNKLKFDNEKTNLRLKKAVNMLMAVIILQIVIGIKTLIFVVPVPLASLHQIMAVIILANVIFIRRIIY